MGVLTRPLLMVILGAPWTGGSTITTPLTASPLTTPKSSATSTPRSLSTLVATTRCVVQVLPLLWIQMDTGTSLPNDCSTLKSSNNVSAEGHSNPACTVDTSQCGSLDNTVLV